MLTSLLVTFMLPLTFVRGSYGKGQEMYIDKQKWDIILDGLHLTDKEKIVAEAIKALLNQAPKPREIMERVIVGTDKENIAVDKLELADMINAALTTLVFMLEEDEQEASEKGEDVDARLRENALCVRMGSGTSKIKLSLGDVIRKVAMERDLNPTRENLQMIRRECDQLYGRSFIPNKMVEIAEKNCYSNVIFTGLRTVEEFQILNRKLNMKLLFVYADESIRYHRLLNRKGIKDAKDIKTLRKQMLEEERLFDYQKLEKKAFYRYDFNIDMETYKRNEQDVVQFVMNKLEGNEIRGEHLEYSGSFSCDVEAGVFDVR